MIRKSNLMAIQNEISNFADGHTVVFNDETSLVAHGALETITTAGVDVSASLFAKIAKAIGNTIQTKKGRRFMHYRHDVTIYEGTSLGKEMVDGLWVYPFKSIKARLEIMGDRRDIRLPEVKTTVEEIKDEKVVKTFENLTDDQATFELRCKAADWYYSYSDDLSVYRRGRDQCEALKKEAEVHGGIHLDIYKYYSSK